MSRALTEAPRKSCTVHLDLSRGANAATARLTWSERPDGRLEATLELGGWIDRGALGTLAAPLDELAQRGLAHLSLDCARVRHVEFAAVPGLGAMLRRLKPVRLGVRGLSPHLRDLFRLAGCAELVPAGLHAGVLTAPPDGRREWTS